MNFIFIILSWVSSAQAFELMPEYSGLSVSERENLGNLISFDTETESDIFAYSFGPAANHRWWSSPTAFRMTMGSLGFKKFLVEYGAKFSKPLTDKVTVKANFVQQEDYVYSERHLILEAELAINEWLSVAGYGEGAHRKSEDDFGLAIIGKIRPDHSVRLFSTWTDFNRNLQNVESDEFRQSPMSVGLVGRWITPVLLGNFLEYAYRYERPSQWIFPDDEREFRFSRTYASIRAQHFLKNGETVYFGVTSRRTLGSDLAFGTGDVALDESTESIRNIFEARYSRAGLRHVDQTFKTLTDDVSRREIMPFYFVKPSRAEPAKSDWGLNWEATFHWAKGPDAIRSEQDKNYAVEHRLNLTWEWVSLENARLLLQFSFDADNLISKTAWEGGNGQFEMLF